MADYELPPLRIKIVGDGKDFRKATDAVIKEAQRLEAELNKKVGNVSPVIVAKSAAIAMNSVFKAIAKHALAMSASVKIGSNIGARELSKAYKDVTRKFITNVSTHVSTLANSLKPSKSGSWALGKAVRTAQSAVLTNLLAGITTVAASSGTLGKTTAQLSNAIRLGINKILRALAKAVRAAVDMAVQKIDVNKFAKNLQKAIERGINKARINTSKVNLSTRNRGSGGSVGGSYGDRGNSFLGDRADIYMHINAVRNLAAVWRTPLKTLTEYQTRIASMAPQLGGMGQAESFVSGMRGTATGQVYGAEIPTAATRLLGANIDLQTTKELLTSIGDIAGGDAERFQGLARAFSQVAAQGNLQGDELEQLAEQNFPLLQLMHKRTGISLEDLREKMAKREITSAAVFAVVKAETAQGGKYAGMLKSLSNTLGVAVQRVQAFYDALQIEVMKTVADQLVKYVNKLASGIVHVTNWVSANRETVKGYVELALKVSAAVVIFHAVGFAVAMVSWQMHALRRIMSILVVVTWVYSAATRTLIGAYYLLRGAVIVAYTATLAYRSAMVAVATITASVTIALWAMESALTVASGYMALYASVSSLATVASVGLEIASFAAGLAAIFAWTAFAALFVGALLLIPAVIAGVSGIAAAIYNTTKAIASGDGGLLGAINRTWDRMKLFAINAVGFLMNIGHNAQVVAKYTYENFWTMVQDVGIVFKRLLDNWVSDTGLTINTLGRLIHAFMGDLVINGPTYGYQIANGIWKGFTWLFTKIKDGFTWVFNYAKSGVTPENFRVLMSGLSGAIVKGATNGFPSAAAEIMKEHFDKSALANNWGGMDLKSPAMEGLKFDWKTVDMLGLADKIPDIDFGAGAIPAQDGTDISKLLGSGGKTAGGKTASTPTTPMAVRAGSADHLDRVDAAMMAMGDPTAKTNAQIATNTGETNVILKQIQQSLVKPGSWSMKAEPAL